MAQTIAQSPGANDRFLVASGISKRFGITQALSNVSVAFRAGEVHALMGENGAGKSTLGKIISGLYTQDEGTITIDGRTLTPGSIDESFHAGIRIVHQELAQCPNLSVAENLSLHAMPTRGFGIVNWSKMRERAARLVHALDPAIDVDAPLGLLSPGRRQICQIAASLDERADGPAAADGTAPLGARVIVFDEPTSSLSVAEADRLLDITRGLAAKGLTIIYVSHRMGEIFQVCDRVTVLRDGQFVATSEIASIDEPTLVEQMIGRRISTPRRGEHARPGARGAPAAAGDAAAAMGAEHAHVPPGEVVLDVRGLSTADRLRDVSLRVRAGEIVGIGGLVGAGRSELLTAIFGLEPSVTGAIEVCGRPLALGSVSRAIDAGLGYVPEDRRNQGLFFQLGIDENIVMPFMSRLASTLGIRGQGVERRTVTERIAEFRVKAASHASLPGELSGGNQQKLLIARWMTPSTRVLLLDEPTRGIDVGTKAEVYKIVREAADKGLGVLLVSSEMPELLALSDRILVMCSGRISGELRDADMTQTNILRLATVDSQVGTAAGPAEGRIAAGTRA
jgi:ABC-type sugar transport system ATPase subunit